MLACGAGVDSMNTTRAVDTNGAAIASLILGILAVTFAGPLAGVPAVICGHIALNRIRRSRRVLTGEGMAIAGLVLGYTSIALTEIVLGLLFWSIFFMPDPFIASV
jgi:hypothetical protein